MISPKECFDLLINEINNCLNAAWEDAYNTDDKKKEELVDDPVKLSKKVVDKLKEEEDVRKREANESKHMFLLLVLDSEGEVKIDELLPLKNLIPNYLPLDSDGKGLIAEELQKPEYKIQVLITSTGGVLNELVQEIKVEPFSKEETKEFLKGNVIPEPWKTYCQDKTKVLPAQLIMLKGAWKRIEKLDPEPQDRASDAALQLFNAAKPETLILRFVYETLINDRLFDFFWHSSNLLGNHGGVQYNALIAHWILEGHLDLADGVKKAYEKGYDIMMELVDLGILKLQEDNLIVIEQATLTLEDHECREHFEKSNLGLAGMLKGEESKVFERMAPTDGMMRTMSVDKEGKSVSSMLIDGSSLCREDPDTFFQEKDPISSEKEKDLKVLALFNPRMDSLPKPIYQIKNLLLLVLRGCYLLNTIDQIKDLENLVALEVSGSPYVTKMEEGLFDKMTKLQSLNLSALGIELLP
ncbi:hypothetical protein F3Y22_tig00111506pilonHSYRG00159 [Hibiscus syriacus]|uniref:NB-ARC domain-containing protein n=1 Tax=Hibiscus syriacus TaxID=106335 RepID=A0A6A2XMC8_HIBSY|nr:hypothetical protein F3Y22_tig00111506pilonHSYRG00159 [Hibiscus syriacus]